MRLPIGGQLQGKIRLAGPKKAVTGFAATLCKN